MSNNFVVNKLEIRRNKIISSAVALFLMLIMLVSIALVLTPVNATNLVNGQPEVYPTASFLSWSPNPLGVGQTGIFVLWIDKAPPTAEGIYGQRFGPWTVNVTYPDGSVHSLTGIMPGAISNAFVNFIPAETGNYSAVWGFPLTLLTNANPPPAFQNYNHPDQIGDYYGASVSNIVNFTVTQTQVPTFNGAPLPTELLANSDKRFQQSVDSGCRQLVRRCRKRAANRRRLCLRC